MAYGDLRERIVSVGTVLAQLAGQENSSVTMFLVGAQLGKEHPDFIGSVLDEAYGEDGATALGQSMNETVNSLKEVFERVESNN